MNKQTEKQLHNCICAYLKLQYPKIIFNTDLSGLKMTIGQARQIKNLRSSSGFPDIQILQPVEHLTGIYKHGLFLEVKKETPYKQNNQLKTDKHLIEQNEFHTKLRSLGYVCEFVWSFEQAKKIIDNYLCYSFNCTRR